MAETRRRDSVNKVVLIINVCISRFFNVKQLYQCTEINKIQRSLLTKCVGDCTESNKQVCRCPKILSVALKIRGESVTCLVQVARLDNVLVQLIFSFNLFVMQRRESG